MHVSLGQSLYVTITHNVWQSYDRHTEHSIYVQFGDNRLVVRNGIIDVLIHELAAIFIGTQERGIVDCLTLLAQVLTHHTIARHDVTYLQRDFFGPGINSKVNLKTRDGNDGEARWRETHPNDGLVHKVLSNRFGCFGQIDIAGICRDLKSGALEQAASIYSVALQYERRMCSVVVRDLFRSDSSSNAAKYLLFLPLGSRRPHGNERSLL